MFPSVRKCRRVGLSKHHDNAAATVPLRFLGFFSALARLLLHASNFLGENRSEFVYTARGNNQTRAGRRACLCELIQQKRPRMAAGRLVVRITALSPTRPVSETQTSWIRLSPPPRSPPPPTSSPGIVFAVANYHGWQPASTAHQLTVRRPVRLRRRDCGFPAKLG